jgi:hypothetical protein
MTLRVLPAILAISTAVLCAARAGAQSQPWLVDRRLGGGIGLRTGDFELHPGIAGEVGYDTNYYQSSGTVTRANTALSIPPEFRPTRPDGTSFGAVGVFDEPKVGTFRFRITPSLSLKTLGPQRTEGDEAGGATLPKLRFEATLSASYNQQISTDARYASAVSDDRFLSGDLGFTLDVLPERPWSLGVTGAYNRSVQPVNDPEAPPSFARSMLRGGTELRWRPGGGVLEWSFGYNFTYLIFEDPTFSNFSSVNHDLSLKGRWLFLPRTALIYAGDYGVLIYPNGGQVKPAGAPLSSRLGVSGLVTNHFSALGVVGWKSMFFDRESEFDGIIGNAELTWYPLPRPDLAADSATVGLSSITLGYRRDAQASYIGNYVASDGGYAKASYFLGGTVLLSLDAAFDHLRRPSSYFSDGIRQSQPFSENRLTATGFAEYRTSDTFGINTTLRYTANLSNEFLPLDNDPNNSPLPYDELRFDRFEFWLGVRWFL